MSTVVYPPRLGRAQLRAEQARTLATPRMRYGIAAKLLFANVDLLYGRAGSIRKFIVLELIARVPYQAWERVGYAAFARGYRDSALARRIVDRIADNRAQQDNEQWHLLALQELADRQGLPQPWLRFRALPWVMAVVYYHLSWLMFVIRPAWSYRLNATFEDHAEHTYMSFVAEHPELEQLPHRSAYEAEHGRYASVADLLRQIGHDERMHKQDSLAALDERPVPEPLRKAA